MNFLNKSYERLLFEKGLRGPKRSGLGRSDCSGKSPGYLSLYESHSGKKLKYKLGRICLLCEFSLNFFQKVLVMTVIALFGLMNQFF